MAMTENRNTRENDKFRQTSTGGTALAVVNPDGTPIGSSGGGGGDATAANQTTQITALGSLTETAPTTDTASSGLNGRLQRIAQRITSLIALLPTALGSTTSSASLPVVIASDQAQVAVKTKDTFGTATALTITLASLANSSAGAGQQSTLITSNTAKSALIAVKFTAGTSPTANTLIYVYLIRGDGTLNDDNAGASDAALTVINAPLLGTILCSAATSNATYYGLFDTKFLGSLGPTFGIAVVNSTGATANATGGNFLAEYTLIT